MIISRSISLFSFTIQTDRLRYTYLEIDQSEPIWLIGIVSAQRDYRMAHFLNDCLNISLCREADYCAKRKTKSGWVQNLFPYFRFDMEAWQLSLFLLQNRVDQMYLVPKHSKTDFWFVAQGEAAQIYLEEHFHIIKALPVVDALYLRSVQEIPNPSIFVFE